MHIEKNLFENIMNTIMDIHGKTNDNVKSRMDVAEVCDRPKLHLHPSPSGKPVKPKRSSYFLWINEESCVNG